MTSEINSIPPVSTPVPASTAAAAAATAGSGATTTLAAAVRSAAATGELLTLLQPEAVLDAGETAPAQVLTFKQAGQAAFEVMLQLTLSSGRLATVQTTSTQPLLPGTQLTVTQLTNDSLAVTVQQGKSDALGSLTQIDTEQLPVGSLLQGKVITSQVVAPGVYRSLVTLLNTSLAGQTLTLDSPQPLRLGSLLSAEVRGAQQLNFVPLSGRLDQLAVVQQLTAQQTRQGSIQGLLETLSTMYANQTPGTASPAVQASVETLLANLPDIRDMADPKTVAGALQGSGVFMEASLLAGGPADSSVPDLKTSLLRLVAQLTPALPAGSTFNPANAAQVLAQGLPGYVRNALGMLGQVGQAGIKPPLLGFPLPTRLLQSNEDDHDLEQLLRLASAAISRLQSHQLSSLEQSGVNDRGNLQTTWQMEIPMRNLQDIVPLQVRIQREDIAEENPDTARETDRETTAKEKLWRIELSFDLSPLGPLQVQAQLFAGQLSSQLWAERPGTARLIENQLGNLRDRLRACGLNVTELNCHLGTPPQGSRTRLEQRWVDENA